MSAGGDTNPQRPDNGLGCQVLGVRKTQDLTPYGLTTHTEYVSQIVRRIHEHIRRLLLQRMRGKAIIHAYGPQSGVASGFNIDV